MTNLFGEECSYPPSKPVNKAKRNWENRFQRWCNKQFEDGTTSLGKCGYSNICDYCDDSGVGRPCVRALNAYLRDNKKHIDYSNNDYEEAWGI